ncbi:unnamed protein product [Caenorhabditis bovis]|uniref:Tetratricopeptide repeat protein n=1 Tax=Caenorhabditis bovis TaxID=2654633 RepID=A0A8S1F5E2_9PELO|nr:unnamed protein product [Caenorhabditis bovis]
MAIIEEVVEGVEDIARRCEKLKLEGNAHFNREQYDEAEESYKKALEMCPESEKQRRAILLTNLSAVLTRKKQFTSAIEKATEALELGVWNERSLERRANAYEGEHLYDKAIADIEEILTFCEASKKKKYRERVEELKKKMSADIEEQKEKLFATLKRMGNAVLSPFGMSTDNFQMTQNASGGWQINMKPSKPTEESPTSAATHETNTEKDGAQ